MTCINRSVGWKKDILIKSKGPCLYGHGRGALRGDYKSPKLMGEPHCDCILLKKVDPYGLASGGGGEPLSRI